MSSKLDVAVEMSDRSTLVTPSNRKEFDHLEDETFGNVKDLREDTIFEREDAAHVLRWDYCLCWDYCAIKNMRDWDNSGWRDDHDNKRKEELPVYTREFKGGKNLGFEVIDGVVANVQASAQSKGIRAGDRVIQVEEKPLIIQDRSKPGKFKPPSKDIDGQFRAVVALKQNESSLHIHFLKSEFDISSRVIKTAKKYREDEDAHRQVFVSQEIHETIKRVKRAKLCYKLQLEFFDDEAHTAKICMDGVLFLLVGASERRLVEEVRGSEIVNFELDPSMLRRHLRREQGLQIGDSAFVTLYLQGSHKESIVYNINRRHSLNQIKADMLTVLRDMPAFRKALMEDMGVTHEGIFFDVGGVAEEFQLYLIDRHHVQGKFEYTEVLINDNRMVQDTVIDGYVFLLCREVPEIDDFSQYSINDQIFSKYALRCKKNRYTGAQEPILPNRVISNYVDNFELDRVIKLPLLGEIGNHKYKKYAVSGGRRFFPADSLYAKYHDSLATAKTPYYKVYRPNVKLVDDSELPVGAPIFGRPAHDKTLDKIHDCYDEKVGGNQTKKCIGMNDQDGGPLAVKHRLKETIFNDHQRIKLVHAILENPENSNPRGAGLNLDKMVTEGSLTKYFVLHNFNTVSRLESRWKNPRLVNRRLNITGAGKSLAQILFKPVPLHSVYSVHNRETLGVPDVYKLQLPGIREYFGEDIAFYFSFANFYNQYLVYIALIGIVAYIFEYITYQEDDTVSSSGTGKTSDSRQAVLILYMIALVTWELTFLETLKRKVFRLSKQWGMRDFNATEKNRIEFRGAYVEKSFVDFVDMRVPILPSSKITEGKNGKQLEGVERERRVRAFYQQVTKRKLAKLRPKTVGAKGEDGKAKYKYMLVDARQQVEWGKGTYFNGVARPARITVNVDALDFQYRECAVGDTVRIARGTVLQGRAKRLLDRQGKSDAVSNATITKVERPGCLAKCCCRAKDQFTVEFEEYFNVQFTEIPHPTSGLPYAYDPWQRFLARSILSWFITAFLIFVVIMTMFALIVLRIEWTVKQVNGISVYDDSNDAVLLGVAVSTINAVIITVFNSLYSSIALALTEFENHRTETQFQVSRTIKVFIFQFVTSFFTLFYAAFGKIQGSKIWGKGPDTCMDNFFKEAPNNRNDCMFELQYSVIVLFGCMIVVNNVFEVGFGILREFLLKCLLTNCSCFCSNESVQDFRRKHILVLRKSRLMQQYFLDRYVDTFDDFAELIIQFGYVTLFAVAFPLSPLFALINNYFIERWLDRNKLLHWRSRPNLRGAQDMGTWMSIIEVMGFLTVTTNAGICVFTSGAFDQDYSASGRVFLFLFIEHLIIILRVSIEYFAPDQSPDIKVQVNRQENVFHNLVYSEVKSEDLDIVESLERSRSGLRRRVSGTYNAGVSTKEQD